MVVDIDFIPYELEQYLEADLIPEHHEVKLFFPDEHLHFPSRSLYPPDLPSSYEADSNISKPCEEIPWQEIECVKLYAISEPESEDAISLNSDLELEGVEGNTPNVEQEATESEDTADDLVNYQNLFEEFIELRNFLEDGIDTNDLVEEVVEPQVAEEDVIGPQVSAIDVVELSAPEEEIVELQVPVEEAIEPPSVEAEIHGPLDPVLEALDSQCAEVAEIMDTILAGIEVDVRCPMTVGRDGTRCGVRLRSRDEYQKHLDVHRPRPRSARIICPCGQLWRMPKSTFSSFKRHLIGHSVTFPCPVSDECVPISRKDAIRRHCFLMHDLELPTEDTYRKWAALVGRPIPS